MAEVTPADIFDSVGALDADDATVQTLLERERPRQTQLDDLTPTLWDTSADSRLVIVNYVESANNPQGAKTYSRLYYLPKNATWATVRNNRFLLVVTPLENYFVDIKENVRYDWDLSGPYVMDYTLPDLPSVYLDLLRDIQLALPLEIHASTENYPYDEDVKVVVEAWRTVFYNEDLEIRSGSPNIHLRTRTLSPIQKWLVDPNIYDDNGTLHTRRYSALASDGVISEEQENSVRDRYDLDETIALNIGDRPNWASHLEIYRGLLDEAFLNATVIEEETDDAFGVITNILETAIGIGLTVAALIAGNTFFAPLGIALAVTGFYGFATRVGPSKVKYEIDREAVANLGDEYFQRIKTERIDISDTEDTREIDIPFNTLDEGSGIYLDAFYNQSPPTNLRAIEQHAGRIYGVEGFTQNIIFSHIDGNGLSQWLAFPPQNQVNTASSGFTPVVALEQMPNKGGLYVFKRDAIHYIEGHNIFSGLYDISVGTQTDISAAASKKNIGCISPNSIINDGTMVLFVGSDDQIYALVDKTASPIGLSVKPFIQELTLTEQENISAQWHKERFYLTLKDSTLLLDTERKFWLRYDWELSDIQWDRGGASPESRLYGLTQDDEFVELNIDNEDETFSIMLETNKQVVPTGSLATAVYVYTEDNETLTVTVTGNEPYREVVREYRPRLGNKYRVGVHVKGRHITMKLECPTPISIDRIMIMETV